MKTIDIVLPVYNEEESLVPFHTVLLAVLDGLADGYRFNLIYVVDPSRDRSFEVLKELARDCPSMCVLRLSRRFGHQTSLIAGLDRSSGDALIMMDSDLQHPPAMIPRLLQKLEEGYDIVHTIRRYGPGVGWWKRWNSSLFYLLQNALSPVEIKDGMADFRLISRKVVRIFQASIREQNQFLRGLFQWVGFRSAEVSFVATPRVAGSTKYRWGRLIAFSVTGILAFSKLPLRIATFVGFSISSLAACYGVWLLGSYFWHGQFPPGYASLILVTLFIGGLQLMFLGVVGEYLGSVFDEVKGRPLYLVDEIVEGGRV